MFAHRLPVAERLATLLATVGVERGLLGPREAPRLWDRHLLNCAVLTDLLPEGADVCDVGSGAGLPGLVLAVRRPDLRVTLVEPLLRRSEFLTEAVQTLGLDQVVVRRARAEELAGTRFSFVTARAVAPLPRLLSWCLPLVRPGGSLLLMKGVRVHEEIAAAAAALAAPTVATVSVSEHGIAMIGPPTTVLRVVVTGSDA